eukprot:TRINITY_DN225_c0_g1_i1.p3 TRINITY_DN225_c0_g1~~TRINITY_DN225_c0_g1_i1.p3  ORF type:complete len:58 (-),score=33.71 TRINITY_DN225_c0_g1_i1:168-341(-)
MFFFFFFFFFGGEEASTHLRTQHQCLRFSAELQRIVHHNDRCHREHLAVGWIVSDNV